MMALFKILVEWEVGNSFSFWVGGHSVWGAYSLGGHEMGYKLFCLPLGVLSLAGMVGDVGESDGEDDHLAGSCSVALCGKVA